MGLHGDVYDHLMVDELVALRRLHHAVQDQHSTELGGLNDVQPLIRSLLGVKGADHFATERDAFGLPFGVPKIHPGYKPSSHVGITTLAVSPAGRLARAENEMD